MKPLLVYPLPFNIWQHYSAYAMRFTDTLKHYDPGADFELVATCHYGMPTDKIREMFYGIKARFESYNKDGCQIGAQQEVAGYTESNRIMVCLTGHAYFFREGWLDRILRAFWEHGDGLYGVAASREGTLHLRTSCFAFKASLLRAYPFPCRSREDCDLFEHGPDCFSRWVQTKKKRPVKVVHWDSINDLEEHIPNSYRHGNQEQMLVWDRHSDLYASAVSSDKERLESLKLGRSV